MVWHKFGITAGLFIGLSGTSALAEEAAGAIDVVRASYWTVELGSYGLFEPKIEGSKTYQFAFKPIVNIYAPNSYMWYAFPNDAATYDLVATSTFHAGPAANLSLQNRYHGEDIDFRLGNSEVNLQLGGFAEYYPSPRVRTRVELLQAAVGNSGFAALFSADYMWKAAPEFMLTFGPRLSLVDDTYATNYYSTRAAATSGDYVRYHAEGGLHAYGSELTGTYKVTPQLSTKFYVDYNRLTGDVADSPRVNLRGTVDQVTVGVGSSYKFSYVP